MPIESNFLQQLNAGLERARIPNGALLIVAFSGGPDSSAILAGLSQLRERRSFRLLSAHVNHKIRADSSDRDQRTAQGISESLGVEFIAIEVDVPKVSKSLNISIESAARDMRYTALSELTESRSADGVVTGHTRDDQAETVLFHASRGSGLKGIAGMAARSTLKIPGSSVDLTVLRPALGISKSDCAIFCSQVGIQPVFDESNESRKFTRNRIRLEVLPLLNESIPGTSHALARLAENVAGDLEIIDWLVDRHVVEIGETPGRYSRSAIHDLPRPLVARIMMRAYSDYLGHSQNLEQTHVTDMVDLARGRSGTSLDLPNGISIFVDRETFGFRSAGEVDCPYPAAFDETGMAIPGTTLLGDDFVMTAEIVNRPDSLKLEDRLTTFASPDLKLLSPTLRNRKNGDRFQPLGMEPRVKLQDFFVSEGVPERWRDRVPIIESESGIAWVVGSRLAEWAKVRPDHRLVTRLELVRPN